MAITVQYAPSAALVAQAAQVAGQGDYNRWAQQQQLQEQTEPAAANQIRILLANVRGLSTRKKMEAFRERFLNKNSLKFDLLLITETHLTRQLDASGW